jgi:hypothetical protein
MPITGSDFEKIVKPFFKELFEIWASLLFKFESRIQAIKTDSI